MCDRQRDTRQAVHSRHCHALSRCDRCFAGGLQLGCCWTMSSFSYRAMAEEGCGCVCYRIEGLSGDSCLSHCGALAVGQRCWLWVSSFMLRVQMRQVRSSGLAMGQ